MNFQSAFKNSLFLTNLFLLACSGSTSSDTPKAPANSTEQSEVAQQMPDPTYYTVGKCADRSLRFHFLSLYIPLTGGPSSMVIIDLFLNKHGWYDAYWKFVSNYQCNDVGGCSWVLDSTNKTKGDWRQISKEQFRINNIGIGTIDSYAKNISFRISAEDFAPYMKLEGTSAKITISEAGFDGQTIDKFCSLPYGG